MGKNLLKEWLEKNSKKNEGLPKNRAEADAMMREGYAPIDAMNINELEIFAKDDNNKVYLAIYANCLLKARQTNKYKEVNRFRRKIGMSTLP